MYYFFHRDYTFIYKGNPTFASIYTDKP